jgi:hypothetical protein
MHDSGTTLCSLHSCSIVAPPNDRTLFSTQHLLSYEPLFHTPNIPTTYHYHASPRPQHIAPGRVGVHDLRRRLQHDERAAVGDDRGSSSSMCRMHNPTFEKALENDLSWPARFGGARLDISDFDSMLPARLRLLLLLKVEKYANRRDDDSRSEAVSDLTRGVDYQLCPGCGKIVTLQDGCHHMTCPCMASFCFIYGRHTAGTSSHWLTGRCPRYGVPKTYGADYDPFPTEANLAHAANW